MLSPRLLRAPPQDPCTPEEAEELWGPQDPAPGPDTRTYSVQYWDAGYPEDTDPAAQEYPECGPQAAAARFLADQGQLTSTELLVSSGNGYADRYMASRVPEGWEIRIIGSAWAGRELCTEDYAAMLAVTRKRGFEARTTKLFPLFPGSTPTQDTADPTNFEHHG